MDDKYSTRFVSTQRVSLNVLIVYSSWQHADHTGSVLPDIFRRTNYATLMTLEYARQMAVPLCRKSSSETLPK